MINFATHDECTETCTTRTCNREALAGYGTCSTCGATCVAVTPLPNPRCGTCR